MLAQGGPVQTGHSQHRRVAVASLDLPDSRIDVAAKPDELQVAAQHSELCLTSQAAGAHYGSRGQVRQASRLARDQRVAGILARRRGEDCQAGWHVGGQVLG